MEEKVAYMSICYAQTANTYKEWNVFNYFKFCTAQSQEK